MLTACSLHGLLSQQLVTTRKSSEELIIEIVPIGNNDDGRILHGRLEHKSPGIERHAQRFARPLRVPDHADTPVAFFAARYGAREITAMRFSYPGNFLNSRSAKRFLYCGVHGMKLMITRYLFRNRRAVVFFSVHSAEGTAKCSIHSAT